MNGSHLRIVHNNGQGVLNLRIRVSFS